MISATRYSAMAQINRQAKLGAEIARAETEISTGKKVQKASDDPISAARISELRRVQADQVTWSRNIETAQSVAAQVDTQMGNMADIFNRVKELTLAGRSESASPGDRAAMVQELGSLRTALSNIATATTPTGQALFPTDAPLQISVSSTVRLAATAQRSTVFDGIAYTHGIDDLDSVIGNAIDAISNDDATTRRAFADVALSDIDVAIQRVTDQRAAQGVRAQQLDVAAETLEGVSTQLAEERSSLEDTNVAATIMKINAKTLTLQAAQAAFAKVNSNTLFDFLR
ncbi:MULTISPECIES: flagellin [unclassified Sphingomonas]|uniref:flagellin n=1 Tax=unclassified Sphingomonas TaxID=196159 RepID=UPI000701352F|nr:MULTISPECIES: flagellin [unclassified Sphingomonas]KQX26107.1 flagellin [Sphingomonas sp. Root1294]KQY69174.1 flagellin [Sphingomonas sp. Root50]KRB89429.1 flagellin [Sphingomonas sp. Root720]